MLFLHIWAQCQPNDRRQLSASQEGAGVDGTNQSPGFSTLYCTSQRYALSVRQGAGATRAA